MPKVTMPTLEDVKAGLHRWIDEKLALREYKGTQFFGTPFEEDGTDAQLTVGSVVGMPKVSFSRLRPTPAISMATIANRVDADKLDDATAIALLAKLEARVYGPNGK